MPERAIANPLAAFGLDDDDEQWGRIVNPYKASAAMTAKRVVILNTDGTVDTAATGSTASLCIGIAENGPAAGDIARVVEKGIVTGVTAQGAIAAGDILKRSGTTAGAVAATASPAAGEPIGFAMAASSGGVVTVYVQKGY